MNNSRLVPLIPLLLLSLILIAKPAIAGVTFTPLVLIACAAVLIRCVLQNEPQTYLSENRRKGWLLPMLIWVAGSTVVCVWCKLIFNAQPIDIAKSDILPLIQDVYLGRWLKGEFVYAPVNGYGYGTWIPNYLPLHWMPFLPAIQLHVDPRWIAVGLLLLAILIFQLKLSGLKTTSADRIVKSLSPFVLVSGLLFFQRDAFAYTVEPLIAGYYILLLTGLTFSSGTLRTIGLAGSLLSRYYSAFFVPADVMLSVKNRDKKQLLGYAIVLAIVVVLYVIPFLRTDPMLFFSGAAAYDVAALGEWKGQAWQPPGDNPFQLFRGYGLASWFYRWYPGTLEMKIQGMKYVLLTSLAMANIFILIWAKKRGQHPLFAGVSMFLVLLVFATFVTVPYPYLYWSLLFSALILTSRIPWVKSK